MKVNFCGYKYRNLNKDPAWKQAYYFTANAFIKEGIDVYISPYLDCDSFPSQVKVGITDDNAIHLYNHTFPQDLRKNDLIRKQSLLNIFLKPTGPTPNYFALDTVGYGAFSSPAYKTDYNRYSDITLNKFFEDEIKHIISLGLNKWTKADLQFTELTTELPLNHILVLGQMSADTTVTEFSFGNHFQKLDSIIRTLLSEPIKDKIVVKLHPTFKSRNMEAGTWTNFASTVDSWKRKGVIVLENFENIHSVLKNTKVAIVENSTSGIECLMNDVPIISYGTPEYVWATQELRHLTKLYDYVTDLSWYDRQKSRSWLFWYMNNYICFNNITTQNRLKEILKLL